MTGVQTCALPICRAKVLSLTPLGQQQVARVEQALNVMRRELLQGLPDEDLQAALRVLLRLEAGVAELPKAAARA